MSQFSLFVKVFFANFFYYEQKSQISFNFEITDCQKHQKKNLYLNFKKIIHNLSNKYCDFVGKKYKYKNYGKKYKR